MAYLHRRAPHTFQVVKRVLDELAIREPYFEPKSVLDFGAGLGSAVWAAQDTWPSLQRLAAVEPNVNMRKLG